MFEPRWYQQACVAALFDYFETNKARLDQNGKPVKRNPLVLMPTGTGKSLVISMFTKAALEMHPRTRIVMLTHVKELIAQNAKTLVAYWPQAPLGIYSAGLNKREIAAQVIFGGIASIKNVAGKLGYIDIVFIDECHLLNPNADSMYQAFLKALMEVNPWLVVIGLSATGYRLGIGTLTNNGIFTDTAFDLTTLEMFNRLVYEGYLAPLVVKKGSTQIDMSGVGIENGDFKLHELQAAADQTNLTDAIVRDILANAGDRRASLIFCAGVDHAEHVSECFAHYGVEVPAVHSKLEAGKRDQLIADFKAGRYWGLTNNNVLTTGFDHPPIDLIAMLRGTTSTGLWVQMLGRGTRPSPESGKLNCLALDYVGNTMRLGPINDPLIPKLKGKGAGTAPVWECPMCHHYNHARAPQCTHCGFLHDMTQDISRNASAAEVMIGELPIVEMFGVNRVLYHKHSKEGKPDSLRVTYQCGLRSFTEWVTLEHGGAPGARARDWWRDRFIGGASVNGVIEPPATTAEALALISHLKAPERIRVYVNTKWPQVVGVEF